MKKFTFKCKKENGEYIEIGVVAKTFEKAERLIVERCKKHNLFPVEYLGWEEI